MTQINQEQIPTHLIYSNSTSGNTPLKQTKKTRWTVTKTMKELNKLIDKFIELINFLSTNKKEETHKKHNYKIETKENKHLIDVGGDFPVALKKQPDQYKKIKEAEAQYEQAEKAFNSIRVFKMKGSIGTIKLLSESTTVCLENLLQKGVLPQLEWETVSKEFGDFKKFLENELLILLDQNDPKTEKLNSEEIESHLKQIFNHTNLFHKKIINTVQKSLEGTPGEKEFINVVNLFARRVKEQVAIYKPSSKDDYLNYLSALKDEAYENLLKLKKEALTTL